MHLRLTVPRVAALTIAFFLGSIILQPTTLRAATAGTSLSSAEPPSTVASDKLPEVYQGSFKFTRQSDMLSALGITVDPADIVTSFPDPSLGIGSQIRIYRAALISINDAGYIYTVRTQAKTFSGLAQEQRFNLIDQDTANMTALAKLDTMVPVVITRISVATVKVSEPIVFAQTSPTDSNLELGVQRIQQIGKDGTLEQTFQIRRQNGIEVARSLISTETLIAPRNQIVINGTKVTNYGSGGASWYGGVAPLTAANKELPKGTKVNVVNLANGKNVIVTIDDRGPFVAGRVIDLSPDAFAQIADLGTGVIQVRMDKVFGH